MLEKESGNSHYHRYLGFKRLRAQGVVLGAHKKMDTTVFYLGFRGFGFGVSGFRWGSVEGLGLGFRCLDFMLQG